MTWIILLVFGNFAFAVSECATGLLTDNRLNDPSALPVSLKRIVDQLGDENYLFGLCNGSAASIDFSVPTSVIGISPENINRAYFLGWKLYHHFDIEGSEPVWEKPAFRGIHNFAHTRKFLEGSSIVKQIRKMSHIDGKPIYDIRINFEPDRIVSFVANSEHAAQNTTSKHFITDESGNQIRWKKTWLSETIQNGFVRLIAEGHGYTLGVYTNKNHPFHDPSQPNGRLVSGTFGIEAGGAFTGISVGMDRTPIAEGQKKLKYDAVGKLAYLAELEYLESLGLTWMDSVTVNPLPRAMGAYFVSRKEFEELIMEAHRNPTPVRTPRGLYQFDFDRWLGKS